MEDLKKFNESEFRKASLLSELRLSQINENPKKIPPKDRFNLVLFVFFFLGFGGMVPGSFFLTATDYWMFKFRDITQDHYDPRNKTYLQTNFASISSIIHSIPTLVTTVLVSMFGHKLDVRFRLLSTLSILTATFILFTIFVVVDTDSFAGILLGVTNFAIIAKFPTAYLKFHMYGSTTAGIFSSILQVICLSAGGNSTQVGLLYYLVGTSILVVTVITAYSTKYLSFFQFYMGDTSESTRKPMPSLSVLMEVSKRMWPFLVSMIWALPTFAWSSPTILILIVPENYKRGDPWTDKYFIPVITFLLPSIIGLLSTVGAKPWMTPKNAKWFILFSLMKTFTLNPLFLFCNESPKHHLPVLFPHDWQYITILVINTILSGYVGTISFLSTPNFAKDKTEEAFILLQAVAMVLGSAFSPLSAVWVNNVL
ncbi:equilibrative nucleoside transporter 3 isoform X2 [Leptinotarsa decemlineata]|uniref:equilibrative nucleoside transporter 3 isoform X2 n=1 Tax=Leptinotarsa decemlineata TaxID=7539 RepID=UPI003D303E8D